MGKSKKKIKKTLLFPPKNPSFFPNVGKNLGNLGKNWGESGESWKKLPIKASLPPLRPEGTEAPSPGQSPWVNQQSTLRPVRAKALKINH